MPDARIPALSLLAIDSTIDQGFPGMATERARRKSDTGGISVKYIQLLPIGPATRVQAVIRPKRPFDSHQPRQVEVGFLKFHSTVVLKCNHLPYHVTIICPPAATLDSVVHLGLREHLRIKSDAGRLELLTGIAQGLRHIHDLDVVHRRLKFETIEADRNGTVRMSDLWRSSDPPQAVVSTANAQPSFICDAPEPGASGVEISKADDMYAFGVLAWELFAGESPPQSADGVIAMADSAPVRLPQPENPELSDEVWDMIERCLELDLFRRMTVAEAEAILDAEPVYVKWGAPFGFL